MTKLSTASNRLARGFVDNASALPTTPPAQQQQLSRTFDLSYQTDIFTRHRQRRFPLWWTVRCGSPSLGTMQICLDGRIAAQRGGTGVSTYGQALAEAIGRGGVPAQRLVEGHRTGRAGRWLAALRPGAWPAPLTGPGIRPVADGFRVAQVHFDVQRRFLRLRDGMPPDLMHWTYPLPMRFVGVPNIYTVHDLIPLLHPTLTGISPGRMRRLLRGVGRAADHVVTGSESARAELIRELGWPAERVTNLSHAVADSAPGDAMVAATLRGLGLDAGGYVLHAGSVEPRKNVRRLVEAYRASGIGLKLVIAGPDGWRAAGEMAGLSGVPGLIRLPWVERATLLALLRGACFAAAPSLAEGFGLVVAEAMAFGVPVLTSAVGSTAEVGGDAAVLIDPFDVAAMAQAMRALAGDGALRAGCRGRGLQRAALFSPDAYAGRLHAFYRRVVREGCVGPGNCVSPKRRG